MTAWVPPRRVTSTATSIVVNSADTALSLAAGSAPVRQWTPFNGGGLNNYDYQHPTSGFWCDVTSDGLASGSSQNITIDGVSKTISTHTAIDWTGRAVYDPVRKRVQWMGKGSGNTSGDWVYNMLPMYDETTDLWSATRGYRQPEQTTSALGSGHIYGNNCIDVVGRRHYKKQFNGQLASSIGAFYVYNLDTESFETSLPIPNEAYANTIGPAEFVTTRGTAGRLWYGHSQGASLPRIIEYDPSNPGAGWVEVVAAGQMAFSNYWNSGAGGFGVLVFNPRAFGGAGAVIAGGGSTTFYIINCSTLSVTPYGSSPFFTLGASGGTKLIREPSPGTGWILFNTASNVVYRITEGGAISSLANITVNLASYAIPVCLDEYGVAWFISYIRSPYTTATRAWLFKP